MRAETEAETNPHRVRILATVALAGAALVASLASTEEQEASRVDAGNDTEETTGADPGGEPETFTVGDVVELGDWHVQVHGVTDPHVSENEFVGPSEGQRWVAVDAEVTNNGDDTQTVSSLMCFELLDGDGFSYSLALTADAARPPDGDVTPGDSRRGMLTYEVPDGAADLTLSFDCDLFSRGSAVISLG